MVRLFMSPFKRNTEPVYRRGNVKGRRVNITLQNQTVHLQCNKVDSRLACEGKRSRNIVLRLVNKQRELFVHVIPHVAWGSQSITWRTFLQPSPSVCLPASHTLSSFRLMSACCKCSRSLRLFYQLIICVSCVGFAVRQSLLATILKIDQKECNV